MASKKPVAKPAAKKVATKPVARPAVKKAPAKTAVVTKAAKVVKPVVPEVEISPPFEMSGNKWTFKCNDEIVSESVFNSIMKDHEAWIIEQAKAAATAALPEKASKRKKK